MRRGFKTEARETAATIRSELGLGPLTRLDPLALATHLDIAVHRLSSFLADHPAIGVLATTEQASFSALTVFEGPRRAIVVNDFHVPGRQANSVAHELAHSLLMHPPTPPFDSRGLRNHQVELEEEASLLGGCLLVPEEMCLHVVRSGTPFERAAAQLGVSERLLRWRVNQVGAVERVRRERRSRPVSGTSRD